MYTYTNYYFLLLFTVTEVETTVYVAVKFRLGNPQTSANIITVFALGP